MGKNKKRYVYLIECLGDLEKKYKIGISNNPFLRLKTLKTANPYQLNVLFTFETNFPNKLETYLHNRYKNSYIDGEWFHLTNEEIEDFIPLCLNIEKGLQYLKDSKNPFF